MNEDWQIDLDSFNILFLPELQEALPPDMLPDIEAIRQQIRQMQKEEEVAFDIRFSVVEPTAASECCEAPRQKKASRRKKALGAGPPSFIDTLFEDNETAANRQNDKKKQYLYTRKMPLPDAFDRLAAIPASSPSIRPRYGREDKWQKTWP